MTWIATIARLPPRSFLLSQGLPNFALPRPVREALASQKADIDAFTSQHSYICKNRCLIRRTRIRSSASNNLARFGGLYWRRQRMRVKYTLVALLGCRSRVGHQHQPKEGSYVRYIADRSHPEVVRRQGKREYFQIAPGG